MSILIHRLDQKVSQPKLLLFSGGEPHAVVDTEFIRGQDVWIEAHSGSMVEFGYLMVVANAVRRAKPMNMGLYLPYFPGGRQDHPEPGNPFTAQIYADMINKIIKPDLVVIADPHSSVTPALIDNCIVITAAQILSRHLTFAMYDGIIAPDAGADKRAHEVAKSQGLEVHTCLKVRDPHTGTLSGFTAPSLDPGHYLIVDDICDGGGTFLGLADCINALHKEPSFIELDLYVTFGIFSKGLSQLKKQFKQIITTNALDLMIMPDERVGRDKLKVCDITYLARNIMDEEL